MGFTKRLFLALAAFTLLAAACSDDAVDQTAVDDVVDDLIDDSNDSSEDPPDETEDPPDESEDPPDEVEDPPDEVEDPGIEVTSACVFLRHYSSEMWPEYPYFASLIVNTATAGSGIIVTHDMVTEAHLTSGDGTGAGFDVNWPVEAPGEVKFPNSIKVDGVELIDTLVNDHLEGQSSFVAAASDFTDEWIVPDPCGFDILLPIGNTLG